jgi:hypothetical protein
MSSNKIIPSQLKTNGYRELKQATFRHLIEVMEGNYDDNGSEFGHLEAISKTQ